MSDEEASGGDDWFDSAFEDEEDEFGTETATGEDEPGGAIDSEESLDGRTEIGSSFDPDRAFGEQAPGEGERNTAEAGGAFGETDSGGELFDDEGFGGFETGEDEAFDDEALSSDIPRLDLGIKGLDDMIQGGVPRRHLIVTIGSAGTGKTTFGLQFLYHGLQNGENAIFITLEQSHESIINTANEWGWGFDSYEKQGSLAVVDLDPVEMANSLDNIQTELPRLIRDFGADRLVLDSVSLLEMMYEEQANRRTEVFNFTRSLKQAGVTTFLTSEASESSPYASRHGIIEYLTDAVFILQYVRGETQEARLAVEIQKIRNANHSREKKPYEITSDGLSVYQQANIF